MKKNLISIAILALLIVNIVVSAITLSSVMSTNKKTAALVTDIASAIRLDLGGSTVQMAEVSVPMADVVTYDILEMMIPLSKSDAAGGEAADNKDHYVQLSLTLSMNSKDKDYEAYGDLTTRESLIKGEINDVVSGYTIEQMRVHATNEAIEKEILERVQILFDSQFIYDVTITSALCQ